MTRGGSAVVDYPVSVRHPAAALAWQTRLQHLWGRIAGGCDLGRDIPAMLAAAGFEAQMHQRYLHRPHFAGYHYWGWAGRG